MIDTPETDAASQIWLRIRTNGETFIDENKIVIADKMAAMERQSNSFKSMLQAVLEHNQMHLDSDSIVGSCNCDTKTNEVKYHRPGCKYRLISERNDALQLARELRDALELALEHVDASVWVPHKSGDPNAERPLDVILEEALTKANQLLK